MKGHLICNTGPLIALAIVDQIEILSSLFDQVTVPLTVHEEILAGGPYGVGVDSYKKAKWLHHIQIEGSVDVLLEAVLDRGEAEVLQAAMSLQADWVLIDERKARKIARSIYGLRVVGTAGILVEAKKQGIIPKVGDLLFEMRSKGYWIHESIVERTLRVADE